MVAKTRKMLGPNPGKENLLIRRGAKLVSVGEALGAMKGGEARTGFLGEGNIIRKPDYQPEPDDVKALKHKKAIQKLLIGIIEPNQLSSRSTPEMDRRSLVNKLNKSLLVDLKRFLPERLKPMAPEELEIVEVFDEEKVEIQELYMQISP